MSMTNDFGFYMANFVTYLGDSRSTSFQEFGWLR